MKRNLVLAGILSAVLALTVVMAAPVMAATATASVTVTGGSLSVTPQAVNLSAIILDGTDKTSTFDSSASPWVATDPTGTGNGWNITVSSTIPTAGTHSIAVSGFQINLTSISKIHGQGTGKLPTTSLSGMAAIPLTGVTTLKIISAAVDKGMGSYNFAPTFQLAVPAETYAGSYSATLTVTMNSAP